MYSTDYQMMQFSISVLFENFGIFSILGLVFVVLAFCSLPFCAFHAMKECKGRCGLISGKQCYESKREKCLYGTTIGTVFTCLLAFVIILSLSGIFFYAGFEQARRGDFNLFMQQHNIQIADDAVNRVLLSRSDPNRFRPIRIQTQDTSSITVFEDIYFRRVGNTISFYSAENINGRTIYTKIENFRR